MIIGTWNSQGYKFGDNIMHNLLQNHNIDILCLQESGDLLSHLLRENVKNLGNELFCGIWKCNRNTSYNILYYSWRNNSRCSMAILIRNGIVFQNPRIILPPIVGNEEIKNYPTEKTENDEGDNERKSVRGAICVNINNFLLLNVHLPSGRPSFARKVFYHILNNVGGYSNIICLGDFNTIPNSWTSSSLRHMNIVNSGYATNSSGNELDYAITNIMNMNFIKIGSPNLSDHVEVIYSIP